MPGNQLTPLGQSLLDRKFVRFNNSIPRETCTLLSQRILDLKHKGLLKKCEQCPSSHWIYNDSLFVEVHQVLCSILTEQLGIDLLTSFNSVRYYPKDEMLERHLDREAAEFSLSLTIDYQGSQIWPFYLQAEQPAAPVNELILDIGDAVLFQGSQLYHWREPLENDWQVQAFFFFVDANGPHKAHAGDMINKYKDRS